MIGRLLALGGAMLALNGCSTPSSPARNLFRSGQDARVYNPMTGRYEWPDEPAASRPSRTNDIRRATPESRETPPPTPGAGDERIYNPQSGRFEPAR